MYSDPKTSVKVLDVIERIEPADYRNRSCLWVRLSLPHFPIVKDSVEFTECPSCHCFEKNVDHETGVVDAYFHLLTNELKVKYELKGMTFQHLEGTKPPTYFTDK